MTNVNEKEINPNQFLKNIGLKINYDESKAEELKKREYEEEKIVRKERLSKAGISVKYQDVSLQDYKTETVETKKNLESIKAYISKIVDKSWNNNLWLCGANGNGKTMLASIIVSELILEFGKTGIKLVKSYEIEDELETAKYFNAKRTRESILQDYYNYNLLLIDEVGRFKSAAESNFLFRILNERYERNLGTVLITNMNKAELKEFLGMALFDRFCENCQSVEFTEESHRRK